MKSGIKTKKDVTTQLKTIKESQPEKLKEEKTTKTTSIEGQIRKARKEYNDAIPNATEMRQLQLQELAEAAAMSGNITKAQHFKSMANAENIKDTFRILKRIIKPEDKSGRKQINVFVKDNKGRTEKTSQERNDGKP